MRKIELKKFGRILISRPDGKEAFAAIRPTLDPEEDKIEIDFSDVSVLTPSWADEFFAALEEMYSEEKIVYLPSDNKSVHETLKVLKESKLEKGNNN